MSKTKILVVEDETILAKDIQSCLGKLGYTVSGIAPSGEEAIEKSSEVRPDLVLMDIKLQGEMDGIEAAKQIKDRFNIPVVYLTAHADDATLARAMITDPYGYILKPFEDRDLQIGIEIALYKHKTDASLKESEDKYRNLVETAQDAIMCDISGIITEWNKSAEGIFGYSKDEIIGKPVNILIPDKYKKEHEEWYERFIKTGEARIIGKTVEVAGLTKEGVEIPIEMSLTYQRLEQEQHLFMAIIRGITERKKAEEQLRKLSHAIENISATVVITDTEGKIEYVNPKFCQLTGYSVSDAIGKNPRVLKSGKTPPEVYKELWKTIKSGKEWQGEFCNRKKSGELYWEAALISPVKDDKGVIINFIAIKDDITEKKKMEQALLQSEKLKSLGTITAGVAHEFNNILAIISGNIQLLDGSRKDDEELMNALRTIKRATNDGANISRRMLKFTKTKKDISGFVPFGINELINVAIDFTMPRWKNEAQVKGINYHMDTEGMKSVPSILCNPTELREVFVNIINNALDAMPDDGRITFRTWSKEGTVFMSISDTGEGMPEEVKKNIFDPFFSTKGVEGTGLGMSTAYGIISGHGGKIKVESEVRKGSTFTLQFPAAAEADSPEESPETKQEIKSKELRILVVDDEEEICNILDKFFSKKGHLVRTVDNGREAIILAKVIDYDLVLCDMAMPEVNGHEVVRALNKLEKRPKIGIITGWGEKSESKDTEELKVDFTIKKPFDFSELTKHINSLGIEGLQN